MINLSLAEIEEHYDLWLLMRATGWKFLPSQLKHEPTRPLKIVLTLESFLNKMERQKIAKESVKK